MPERKCTKTKAKIASPNKRITWPIAMEKYREIVNDFHAYRQWVDELIVQHPELFPKEMADGYTLHDERTSEKMKGMRLRRICLKSRNSAGKKQVFTLAPSGVMPYSVGYTDEVEKALFLRRFDVPFWALTYVFGQDDSYWYRMENHFGRYEVVQTVVKGSEKLPLHLLADEKITWLNGEEVVVATTVGEDCVLGVSVALGADTQSLTEAYQHFKDEAQALKADYAPETVNTDGWTATQRAWLSLFPMVILIECFFTRLHQNTRAWQTLERTLQPNFPTGLGCLSGCGRRLFPFKSRRTPSLGRKEYDWLCSGGSPQVVRQNGTLCSGLRSPTCASHQQHARPPHEFHGALAGQCALLSWSLGLCRTVSTCLGIAARLRTVLPTRQNQSDLFIPSPPAEWLGLSCKLAAQFIDFHLLVRH